MSTARRKRTAKTSRRRGASTRPRKQALAIVGAGRAGSALAVALAGRGWPVAAVVDRSAAAARRLANRCGAGRFATELRLATGEARSLLVAVPDDALEDVASKLARDAGSNGVALHTSGVAGADALAPLRDAGWSVGSFHPLMTFPDARGAPPDLTGVTFTVDGDASAKRLAGSLARSLGGRVLALPESERGRYHLAACFASNYVVTLVAEAMRLLDEAGVSRKRALDALLPLLKATVDALESRGLPRALTGPVARGDAGTVSRHAGALARSSKDRRALHRALVRRTIGIGREAGWLDAADARRIEDALERSGS